MTPPRMRKVEIRAKRKRNKRQGFHRSSNWACRGTETKIKGDHEHFWTWKEAVWKITGTNQEKVFDFWSKVNA